MTTRISTANPIEPMVSRVPESASTHIDSFPYETDRLAVHLGPPILVAVSPEDLDCNQWGVFQFPFVWRTAEKRGSSPQAPPLLQLQVHNGLDTKGRAGYQGRPFYFESADNGETWGPIEEEAADFTPPAIEISPTEGKIRIGAIREDVHQAEGAAKTGNPDMLTPNASVLATLVSPNQYGIANVYRFGDLPESFRSFPISRCADGARWTPADAFIDFPELRITAFAKSRVHDDWVAIQPRLPRLRPRHVVSDGAGTLIGLVQGQHPDRTAFFLVLYCIASTDGGATWRPQGIVADDPSAGKWGYSAVEADLVRTPSGELVCVSRTDQAATTPGDSRHTVQMRSSDNGRTWSAPRPVAPYSVRPQLIPLECGATALLYGRPGVHLLFSDAECREWHTPRTVIGRHLDELKQFSALAGGNLYGLAFGNDTCGNARHAITAPNRFLVAYADFNLRDDSGRPRKLINVREVTVRET